MEWKLLEVRVFVFSVLWPQGIKERLAKSGPLLDIRLVGWWTYTFPGSTVVKNLPANAGDTRGAGLIPGSGRSSEVGNASHCNILA